MTAPVKTVAEAKAKALNTTGAALKRAGGLVAAFPSVPEPEGKVVPTIVIQRVEGERPGTTAAKKLLKNKVNAALVMQELVYGTSDLMEVQDHCKVLRAYGETAAAGDISNLKEMLAVQAVVLDGIFTQFARRAALSKGVDDLERMMRVALKAQSQSRCAVESLALIQQGPPIFSKQTNIAQNGGQQQVNNGVVPPAASPVAPRARARKLTVGKTN